tara:strand:+ start:615 stop:848 length:234 start_codon:yes stop_codon:yes gene_type:complete
MCSLQTSTGTALTHREEENRMTGAAMDEEDELLPFFDRLAGGDVLFVEDIFEKLKREVSNLMKKWPQKSDGKPLRKK